MDRLEDALVRLAEAQHRTEESLAQLTVRVDQLAARIDQLAAHVDQLAAHVAQLAAHVDQLAAAQARTEVEIARLAREVGRLKGLSLELEYREKAAAYFQPLLARIRLVSREELETLASDAEDRGVLSATEHASLLHADVVLRGRWRDGRADAYLVVEVSAVVDVHDVERALERATVLGRIVPARVIVAVAGDRIVDDADRVARRSGVWQVLNGRAVPPDTRGPA